MGRPQTGSVADAADRVRERRVAPVARARGEQQRARCPTAAPRCTGSGGMRSERETLDDGRHPVRRPAHGERGDELPRARRERARGAARGARRRTFRSRGAPSRRQAPSGEETAREHARHDVEEPERRQRVGRGRRARSARAPRRTRARPRGRPPLRSRSIPPTRPARRDCATPPTRCAAAPRGRWPARASSAAG